MSRPRFFSFHLEVQAKEFHFRLAIVFRCNLFNYVNAQCHEWKSSVKNGHWYVNWLLQTGIASQKSNYLKLKVVAHICKTPFWILKRNKLIPIWNDISWCKTIMISNSQQYCKVWVENERSFSQRVRRTHLENKENKKKFSVTFLFLIP